MNSLIPVMRPRLAAIADVVPYLESVNASGIFSNHGPQVRRLEERFAEWFGVSADRVIAVSNGTVALSAAAASLEIQRSVIPEWTFPATPLGPLHAGRSVEFRDVHPETWYLDPTDADRSDADSLVLYPVVPFGGGFDPSPWSKFPHLVLDAAASVGAGLSFANIPSGWAVTISLHATKVLGCGEGGLVIVGDASRAAIIRQWINFGFSGARVTQRIGTNGKMSEYSASFAHAALDNWETERAEWLSAREVADTVSTDLGLDRGPTAGDRINPYWVFDAGTTEMADRVNEVLTAREIGTRRWWPAAMTQSTPFASSQSSGRVVAEALAGRVVGLPMFRGLTTEHGERIRDAIAEALRG